MKTILLTLLFCITRQIAFSQDILDFYGKDINFLDKNSKLTRIISIEYDDDPGIDFLEYEKVLDNNIHAKFIYDMETERVVSIELFFDNGRELKCIKDLLKVKIEKKFLIKAEIGWRFAFINKNAVLNDKKTKSILIF